MDPEPPPPQAQDQQPLLKVKVATHDDTPAEADSSVKAVEGPSPQPARKHPNWLGMGAVALALLGVIALSTVWLLSRPGSEARRIAPSKVPKDAVALINSSTPITLTLPLARAQGNRGSLSDPPTSEGRSGALGEAHRAQEEGRYGSAVAQYTALVGSSSDEEARNALWRLAGAYEAGGQPELAIRAYTIFAGLDDPRAGGAFARIGRLHEARARSSEAIEFYGKYAAMGGPAGHAVSLMAARLMGATAGAQSIYREVLNDKPLDVDMRQALAGLAEVESKSGDHAESLKLYDQLAALRQSNPRSTLDNNGVPPEVSAAEEAAQGGDKTGARKRLLDYVKGGCKDEACRDAAYPYGLYVALNALLKIDDKVVVSGTVQPMMAANIAYNTGYYSRAISYLDTLRATTPGSPQLHAASLLTGKAFELSGDPATAYNWYTATVQGYPAAPEAAQAIRKAGDMLEEQLQWDAALAVYKEAGERYPNAGAETALARIHGAVLAYRLEQNALAAEWLRPVVGSGEISPTLRAEAAFWAGKLEKKAGSAAWRETLGLVSQLTPGTYLAFRAQSILEGEPDGGPLAPTFGEAIPTPPSFGTQYAGEGEEREALLAWADTLTKHEEPTLSLPKGRRTEDEGQQTPRNTAPANVTPTNTPHSALRIPHSEIERAMALLDLGFEEEAYTSFRALADGLRAEGNARGLAEVAIYLRYHARARTSMLVAQTLEAMHTGDPGKLPTLLLKTLYPTPYSALVVEESRTRNLDPRIMYALIRQESQFVPNALSHADARGLTQVIPSTGRGIAEQLGDSEYAVENLYMPHVSIRYGAYYLASNFPQFGRKLLPSLAAYNGGPGNAERWLAGSALLDPDLYAERIDLFETEDYLKRVYINYGFYRLAYTP